MESIGIITDSCSDISPEEAERLGVLVLPLPIYIDGECYYEGETISKEAFFEKLENGADITTSQPSPDAVTDIWDRGLDRFDKILYMPISSGLSGSYETAEGLAQDEKYKDRVILIDHGQVSAPLYRLILDTLDLIGMGYDAETIRRLINISKDHMLVYIGVLTLENLKKGGRVTPAVAAIGTALNIKPVLKLQTGTLDVFVKCRGFAKARKVMIDAMKNELATEYKDALEKGYVHLLAAGSAIKEETEQWLGEMSDAFPGMEITYKDLSPALSTHVGRGGLGIGLSVNPLAFAECKNS